MNEYPPPKKKDKIKSVQNICEGIIHVEHTFRFKKQFEFN